jgi:hypothetical protein
VGHRAFGITIIVAGLIVTACGSSTAAKPRFDGDTPSAHRVSPSNRVSSPSRNQNFPPEVRATRIRVSYVRLPVASADLDQIVRVQGTVLAALADEGAFFGEVYPAISTDDGGTWRIAGPRFYRAAADGAATTTRLVVSGNGTLMAWGHGGSLVKTSSDLGRRWYQSDFAEGVEHAGVAAQRLVVRALGFVGDGAPFTTRRYVSTDDGRTWHRGRELPPVP